MRVGKLCIFLMALIGTALMSQFSQAVEIVTRCPNVSPNDGATSLAGITLLHYGDMPLGDGADTTLRIADSMRSYVLSEMEMYDFHHAAIECLYEKPPAPAQIVKIPVPGLLLRCESVQRKVSTKPLRWMSERFWCTSRVE